MCGYAPWPMSLRGFIHGRSAGGGTLTTMGDTFSRFDTLSMWDTNSALHGGVRPLCIFRSGANQYCRQNWCDHPRDRSSTGNAVRVNFVPGVWRVRVGHAESASWGRRRRSQCGCWCGQRQIRRSGWRLDRSRSERTVERCRAMEYRARYITGYPACGALMGRFWWTMLA